MPRAILEGWYGDAPRGRGEKDAGRKLKYFVRGDLGVSYTQFSSLKMSGGVRVNGEAALANTLLKAGDVVEVFWPEDAPAQAVRRSFCR